MACLYILVSYIIRTQCFANSCLWRMWNFSIHDRYRPRCKYFNFAIRKIHGYNKCVSIKYILCEFGIRLVVSSSKPFLTSQKILKVIKDLWLTPLRAEPV